MGKGVVQNVQSEHSFHCLHEPSLAIHGENKWLFLRHWAYAQVGRSLHWARSRDAAH